jgi:hypothetical protein
MAKMANIGNFWNKARETTKSDRSGDFIPVDPGAYVMQLVKADVGDYGGKRKIWLKFAVVNGDDRGAICNFFEGIDTEERLVWVQRLLANLGVDLADVEIGSEADLMEVFENLVQERVCAKVAVTEKDGYTNMRVKGLASSVDEDDLHDPEELFGEERPSKGSKSSKAAAPAKGKKGPKAQDPEEDEDEDGEEEEDEDDADDEDGEEEDAEGDDEEEDEAPAKPAKKGAAKPEPKAASKPAKPEAKSSKGKPAPEPALEFEVGDLVLVNIRGKQLAAEVTKYDAKKDLVTVKYEKTGKVETVASDVVDFQLED